MKWRNAVKGEKVLVTGGMGALGTHLCPKLKDAGARVTIIDDNSRRMQKYHSPHHAFDSFYPVTINRSWRHPVNLKTFTYIIHLAAKRIPFCEKYTDIAYSEMLHGATDLMLSSYAKRFVFASSASVYTSYNVLAHRMKESHEKTPGSLYGILKYWLEKFAQMQYASYGKEYVGLRFFNLYGPHMIGGGLYDEVLMKWMRILKNASSRVISANCNAFLDWVYLDDAAEAVCAALSDIPANNVCNVGTGYAQNLLESAKILRRVSGNKSEHIYVCNDQVLYRCANIEKILPYWQPRTDFEQGCEAMWREFATRGKLHV